MANLGGQRRTIDGSAIVDMDIMDDDNSDYEVDLSAEKPRQRGADDSSGGFGDDLKQQAAAGMANYVWNEGSQRARKAFSLYANIDILRPYFDVEPHQVRTRLLQSLVPKMPKADTQREKVPRELYGPTMIVFTLVALLLYQMKHGGHEVQEGTLMGAAFGTCFGYWLGMSSLVWVMAYVCNTQLTIVQILNLLGYALFGHCVVLFLTTVVHSSNSHLFFYLLWAVVCGASTLKMVSILVSRTTGKTQRMIICAVVAAAHLLFILYLHFAYHRVVEELSNVIGGPIEPAHVAPKDTLNDAAIEKDFKKITDAIPGKVPNEGAIDKLAGKVDADVAQADDTLKRVIRESAPVKADAAVQVNQLGDNIAPKDGTATKLKIPDADPPKEMVDTNNNEADEGAGGGEEGDIKKVETKDGVAPPKASKTRKNIPGKSDTNVGNKDSGNEAVEKVEADVKPIENINLEAKVNARL